ncbi:MAG: DEAD/DEAH box helicase [Pseudomonadota bacterium]|nr:DEAD/DEAH box helicase [Pseudomonadota bacterium]
MPFSSLGVCAGVLRAIADQGYSAPTPIQSKAIPPVLKGRDLLAAAQTGTGKTAGFTLPLLERLTTAVKSDRDKPGYCKPRALILTPTRELAAQVASSVVTYGKYLPLRSAVIFGGVNINPQIDRLKRGVDIIVATPGRLLDHVQQKTVNLSGIEILVLDEADRMLDMGFIPDIRRIMARLPTQRQTLMFSATFSDPVRKLAYGLLRDPALVEVAPRNATLDQIEQRAYRVAKGDKRALLAHLLTTCDWPQILVFTRTKHGANRLAEQLSRDGIKTDAIHGNKSQSGRTQALAGFKRGMVRALIATDIAARGLDIAQLPLVVNFELPHVAQDYIHRIGRTGRAGSAGLAVSLICPEEHKLLANIERVINRRLTIAKPSDFQPGKPTVTARLLKAKTGGWPTGSSTRRSTGATSTPFPG